MEYRRRRRRPRPPSPDHGYQPKETRACSLPEKNDDGSYKRIIHIEEGQDYLLEPNEELRLLKLRNLGQGGCANVEEVADHTDRVFAHKVYGIYGSPTERRRIFDNEIKVIRRLAPNHHITRIFATYVATREVGILLTPVADSGSLDIFLLKAHHGLLTHGELETLHYSFGCIVSGLLFMHTQKVRHKDIKPHNILVHKGTFIYTDFGSSLDYSAATRSVTTGRPDTITRKYAAPELHDWSPRSSKTDIFSLGCVFLEILGALVLGPIDPTMTPYGDHIEEIHKYLRKRKTEYDDWIQVVIEITCKMLHVEPEVRPSARATTAVLLGCLPDAFCEQCRASLCKARPMMQTLAIHPSSILLTLPILVTENSSPSLISTTAKSPEEGPHNVADARVSRMSTKKKCPECGQVNKHWRDHKKHMLKHPKDKEIATPHDLGRHEGYVHHEIIADSGKMYGRG